MYKILLIVSLLLPHTLGYASGASSSSGAGALVNTQSPQTATMLLDLWESDSRVFPRNVFPSRALDIADSGEPIDRQLEESLVRLCLYDLSFCEMVRQELAFVTDPSHQWDIPPDLELPAPPDAQNDILPRDYELKGMFLFDDEDRVLTIDRDIYESLKNNTHKAAAWMHEAIYITLRKLIRRQTGSDDAPETSSPARRLTACLFSNDFQTNRCMERPHPYSLNDALYRCRSADQRDEVYLYRKDRPAGGGGVPWMWFVQFRKMDGQDSTVWWDRTAGRNDNLLHSNISQYYGLYYGSIGNSWLPDYEIPLSGSETNIEFYGSYNYGLDNKTWALTCIAL